MPKTTIKVTSRYQMVIPKELRKQMQLQPGDELIASVENGILSLCIKPQSYTQYLLGYSSKTWQEQTAQIYQRVERNSWNIDPPNHS